MLSVNGRIEWRRVRYYSPGEGSDSPIDQLVDVMESAISVGMRELCCRMGIAGRSFARSMENLHEAAQIRMSEEMLRNVVESDGKAVLKASAQEQLEIDRLVGVTRKDHRGLGKLLGREAARVRLRAATERVGLVDGAVCLRNHLEVLPLERVLLDFFHLSEHVNDASRKTLGEKTEAGEKWVHEVLHT